MRVLILAAVLLVQGCASFDSSKPVCGYQDTACLDNQVFLQRYYKIRSDCAWEQRKKEFIY